MDGDEDFAEGPFSFHMPPACTSEIEETPVLKQARRYVPRICRGGGGLWGPRVIPSKTTKSSDLYHYFLGGAQFHQRQKKENKTNKNRFRAPLAFDLVLLLAPYGSPY